MTLKLNQLEFNLERLKASVNEFLNFYEEAYDFTTMIYKHWNARDILGHITFWHESFARNISDLGNGRKPNPLKGKLSEVNRMGVESTKDVPVGALTERLMQAQYLIEKHIFDESIDKIPYKKGSRDYSRCEHLEIVAHHIQKHLQDLKKKYGKTHNQTGTA